MNTLNEIFGWLESYNVRLIIDLNPRHANDAVVVIGRIVSAPRIVDVLPFQVKFRSHLRSVIFRPAAGSGRTLTYSFDHRQHLIGHPEIMQRWWEANTIC